MLRINRQTDYAVRVLLALAQRGEQTRLSTTAIQQEMLIPQALASRIVADLARGGFIITQAGREGGIQLARPAKDITLLEVVEFFEGQIHFSECVDGKVVCPFEEGCPVQKRWVRLDMMVRAALNKVNFEELAQESLLGQAANLNSLEPAEVWA